MSLSAAPISTISPVHPPTGTQPTLPPRKHPPKDTFLNSPGTIPAPASQSFSSASAPTPSPTAITRNYSALPSLQSAAAVERAPARSTTAATPRAVRAVTRNLPGRLVKVCPAMANETYPTLLSSPAPVLFPAALTSFARPIRPMRVTAVRKILISLLSAAPQLLLPVLPPSWPWWFRKPLRARATPTTFFISLPRNPARAALRLVHQPALAFFTTSLPAQTPCL